MLGKETPASKQLHLFDIYLILWFISGVGSPHSVFLHAVDFSAYFFFPQLNNLNILHKQIPSAFLCSGVALSPLCRSKTEAAANFVAGVDLTEPWFCREAGIDLCLGDYQGKSNSWWHSAACLHLGSVSQESTCEILCPEALLSLHRSGRVILGFLGLRTLCYWWKLAPSSMLS